MSQSFIAEPSWICACFGWLGEIRAEPIMAGDREGKEGVVEFGASADVVHDEPILNNNANMWPVAA